MLAERSVVGKYLRALLTIVVAAPLLVGAAVAAGYGHLYQGTSAVALASLVGVLAVGIVATASIVVLRRSDNRLHLKDHALAATTTGIIITDHRASDEPAVFVNTAFSTITGYAADQVLGRNCRILHQGAENDAKSLEALRHCLDAGCRGTFELQSLRKNGTTSWNRLSMTPIENSAGVITHMIWAIDDVTPKRAQESELQQAQDDAQAAHAMRDMFVRQISHELRTPLNAALTWIRLIEVDDRPETLSKGLSVISDSIESQSQLIDDLVDITRFRSAGALLEPETVNVRELVEVTVDELRPMIEPDLTISVRVDDGDYTATLDRARVHQIVRNLVSNAHKYTTPGGRIDIALTIVGSSFELNVADTGKGLTQAQLAQVFEPFWRADHNLPGMGVGLAIVAALVAAHNGTILAKSTGPGKGSVFTVHLPLDASPSGNATLHDEDTNQKSL